MRRAAGEGRQVSPVCEHRSSAEQGNGELEERLARAEERLARFEHALSLAPVVLATTDAELRYTWVYSPHPGIADDVLGRRGTEITDDEGTRELEEVERHVLRTGRTCWRTIGFPLETGTAHYHITASPLRDADGGVTGVRVCAVDVTDQRQREALLQEALRSERRLRVEAEQRRAHADTIVHAAPFGILCCETVTGRVTANRALEGMVDASVTLQDRTLPQLRDADGARLPAGADPVRRALRGERLLEQEYLIQRADGGAIPVLVNAAPVPDGRGGIAGCVLCLLDITVHKQLERLQRDHVALISHDLRQPLQSIATMISLLSARADGGLAEFAEVTMRTVRNMRAMVDDLLETAHLESGRLQLHTELIEPRELVDDLLGSVFEPQCDRIQLRFPPELPPVRADRRRIGRVLQNLIGNALAHSPGDAPIEIGAGPPHCRGDIELWVRDHGPGISPERAGLLFQKFSASSESERRGGTGLGLYSCRLLTEAHGGSCGVDSALGLGSRFWIRLPVG